LIFAACFVGDLAFKHYLSDKQEANEPTEYQKYSENPVADVDPALLTIEGQKTGDFARDAVTDLEPTTVNVLFCSG